MTTNKQQQTNMKNNNLKHNLSAAILMMMAGFYDKHNPAGNNDYSEAIIVASKLVTDGIAEKLTRSLSTHAGELTPQHWNQFVVAATRNAFIELPDGGPMLKLAENPSFAPAVEACTAKIVAPLGSTWALALLKTEEQALRSYLETMNVPPKEIKRLVSEWRQRPAIKVI